MRYAKLVPELVCSDVTRSIAFYTGVLGFAVSYARPEEGFAYLDRDGAQLMLDQRTDRSWTPAALTHPYGRGINLQIEVSDAASLLAVARAAAASIFLPLEDRWYRVDGMFVGSRQFIVEDPDGYLLRFSESLGERPDAPAT